MITLTQLVLLLLVILIVILVLTVLVYTKKTIKNVTAGTSNVTVEESNGNAVISVTGGGSGDFLPLSGGTMSGSINMNNYLLENTSNVQTNVLTLTNNIVNVSTNSSGNGYKNLFINSIPVAQSAFINASDGTILQTLTGSLYGEIYIYSGNSPTVNFNITTDIKNTLIPGFYIIVKNGGTGNVTVNVNNIDNPSSPVNLATTSLAAGVQEYLYYNVDTTFAFY